MLIGLAHDEMQRSNENQAITIELNPSSKLNVLEDFGYCEALKSK
jgi:hypothetical protein